MPRKSDFKFTETNINRLKPASSRYWRRDSTRPGLLLRVAPSGKKSWYVQFSRSSYSSLDGEFPYMTIAHAWSKAQSALTDYTAGRHLPNAKQKALTLEKYLKGEYLEHARVNTRTGADNVTRLLNCCKPMLSTRLDSLTQIQIEKWKRSRLSEVSASTAKRDLATLKAALNRAVKWNLIGANPAEHVTIKAPQKMVDRYLSDEERTRLMDALTERDEELKRGRLSANAHRAERGYELYPVLAYYGDYLTPLIITVLNTGLRKGEALTLDWKSVQLEGIPTVEVVADQAKSYKSRKIPLNDTAIQILKRWKSQGTGIGPVFPNPANGLPMSDIKTAWRKLLKAAKINSFRFHDLRHDFASQLVMKGADLYRVKDLLGHSSIAVTERYAHLAPKALKDAVDLIG